MSRIARPRKLLIYTTTNGAAPFSTWIQAIRDQRVRARILRRVDRMRLGNFGDYRPVGSGILEMRMFFGSGYRIYFGEIDRSVVLLLCGGDKSDQQRDIARAKSYWADFNSTPP